MSLRSAPERLSEPLVSPPKGFRADIQALRAVAVAIVVVFHIWPEILPGGYVGVDVFFVISGFLITGHLIGDVARTGTVSLTAFWGRRIRRLLPAAFVVLAACVLITFFLLPSTRWEQTLFEIGASALYVENWVLASNSVDYLAASNIPSLVQHFWSLSTEEQFYIAWPLLILAGLGVARLVRRRANPRLVTGIVLALIFGASLAFSISFTKESPTEAYFSTFTRAWEFAAGGLLASLPAVLSSGLTGRIATHVRSLAGWAGLGAIAITALRFSGETMFPGSRALLPVLGAVAVMWAGSAAGGWGPAAIARFVPLQFLGGISYSLYLWHWPLIVTAGVLFGTDINLAGGLALIAISVVLAWLTRRFVEDPVRFQPFWARRRRYAFVFAAAGMALLIGTAAISIGTLRSNQAAQVAAVQEQIAEPDPASCLGASAGANQGECDDAFAIPASIDPLFAKGDTPQVECTASPYSAKVRTCLMGSGEATATSIAILGDSHAGALLPVLDEYGKDNGIAVHTFIKQGCSGLDPVPAPHRDKAQFADFCADWATNAIDAIISDDTISTVVMTHASNARAYYADTTPERLTASLKRLTDAGKTVLYVLDAPSTGGRKIPDCLAESGNPAGCASARAEVTTGSQRDAATIAQLPGVTSMPLENFLCDTDTCYPVVGGVVGYFDADHLSTTFVLTLRPFINDALEEAAANRGQ